MEQGGPEPGGRPEVSAAGPSIVVEESPWVFLPVDVQATPWPRAESWVQVAVPGACRNM